MKYKYACGCINPKYTYRYTVTGASRLFCPTHDQPAIERINTCSVCGRDYSRPIPGNGNMGIYCAECRAERNRESARKRIKALSASGGPHKYRPCPVRWTTYDEIDVISKMPVSRVERYLAAMDNRAVWVDEMDPGKIREYCQARIGGQI